MTRQLIEITFGNAMAQANQLDQCAEDMLNLANGSMESVKSDLASAWQGTEAEAYIRKMDSTSTNIRKTASRLKDIANTIRAVARLFRATELRAIELAEQRTY